MGSCGTSDRLSAYTGAVSTGRPSEPVVSVSGGDQVGRPSGVVAVSQAHDPYVRMFTTPETIVPPMPPTG